MSGKLTNEKAELVATTATWLFRACMSGVASRDVRDRRMTKEEASAWIKDAAETFEQQLRSLADLPPPPPPPSGDGDAP